MIAYQSDDKGGVKVVEIDEPLEMVAEREKVKALQALPDVVKDLQIRIEVLEKQVAELAINK
jgi:hypothetical protein